MKLTGIWSDALSAPDVGVHDDIFKLGGHSDLSVRLMPALHKEFGRELPMAALIQAPGIEQQAALPRRNGDVEAWTPRCAFNPREIGSRFSTSTRWA